ncbi:MAG TPA: hypothetical protein VFH06_05040 [Candidatus Saccharimonadales bacterium]|nr:hypothetical protein [Candidatus Saccharimonadales bacterium]
MTMTAEEWFSIPLDTPQEQLDELLHQARMRLAEGEAEIAAVRSDDVKMATARRVSEGSTPEARQTRVQDMLATLSNGVDTNTGLSKPFAFYYAFGIMKPLTVTKNDGARVPMLVLRNIVNALGLTELVTAMFAILYLTADAELRGSFAWRQLNPHAVPLTPEG